MRTPLLMLVIKVCFFTRSTPVDDYSVAHSKCWTSGKLKVDKGDRNRVFVLNNEIFRFYIIYSQNPARPFKI